MTLRQISILGSTGSIGVNTLDVVARHPDRFRIVALAAHRQIDRLRQQCIDFRPEFAVIGSAQDATELQKQLKAARCNTEVLHGEGGLDTIASLPQVDTVMAAIVGILAIMRMDAIMRCCGSEISVES